jgi:hypothetical protein
LLQCFQKKSVGTQIARPFLGRTSFQHLFLPSDSLVCASAPTQVPRLQRASVLSKSLCSASQRPQCVESTLLRCFNAADLAQGKVHSLPLGRLPSSGCIRSAHPNAYNCGTCARALQIQH